MQIPHLTNPERSRFYPPVRAALATLREGEGARVELDDSGGYAGTCRVQISGPAESSFEAHVELRDWTRFPARIRAACTAMRDAGLSGTFDISHEAGALTIVIV